jgi:hypothetical protein
LAVERIVSSRYGFGLFCFPWGFRFGLLPLGFSFGLFQWKFWFVLFQLGFWFVLFKLGSWFVLRSQWGTWSRLFLATSFCFANFAVSVILLQLQYKPFENGKFWLRTTFSASSKE